MRISMRLRRSLIRGSYAIQKPAHRPVGSQHTCAAANYWPLGRDGGIGNGSGTNPKCGQSNLLRAALLSAAGWTEPGFYLALLRSSYPWDRDNADAY